MAVTGTGTGVYTFSAEGDIATGVFIMDSVRWVSGDAASDVCKLMNKASTVLFGAEADGANYTDGWVFNRLWCEDPRAGSLSSGYIQIYMSPR